MTKYYLDTSIWIDYYENRTDKFRPLGDWAHRLLVLIETNEGTILISDFLLEEMEIQISKEEIETIMRTYKGVIEKVDFSIEQTLEARRVSKERKIPFGDVLHAIIARDNWAIMVTRDRHFQKITDIIVPIKPEEII